MNPTNNAIKPDLVEYLNYIVTWADEKDEHIQSMISELHHLLGISAYHFEPDEAIEQKFGELMLVLRKIEQSFWHETITEYFAGFLAIGSILSFGLGMPLLIAAEMDYTLSAMKSCSQLEVFYEKLKAIDLSIVGDMGEPVKNYFSIYKTNNQIIADKGNFRISLIECRIYLLQFMFEVYTKTGELDVATFKQWAHSARLVHDSKEIKDIGEALKKLDPKGDVESYLDIVSGIISTNNDLITTHLVVGLSTFTMSHYLKIENDRIKKAAEAKSIPSECVNADAFKAIETVGTLADNIMVTKKIVDQILYICGQLSVIEQVNSWYSALFGQQSFQINYKQYFNNIKQASTSFKMAMSSHNPITQ